jgi:hypothetical protein
MSHYKKRQLHGEQRGHIAAHDGALRLVVLEGPADGIGMAKTVAGIARCAASHCNQYTRLVMQEFCVIVLGVARGGVRCRHGQDNCRCREIWLACDTVCL